MSEAVDRMLAKGFKRLPVVVRKEELIEETITLMIEKILKRMPVVGDDGRFLALITREALLFAGAAWTGSASDLS